MKSTVNDDLFEYSLRLADNALILGQRLGEWCGHGPILEQDIALTNISLDLIGHARMLYQFAAELEGKGRSEDDLAFLRLERAYKNVLLVELPNGNFGTTILRQFFFDVYNFRLYSELKNSKHPGLAGIASKALMEIAYHRKFSAEWVIRLGDGTDESHEKMKDALDFLWPFTGELTEPDYLEHRLAGLGVAPDMSSFRDDYYREVNEILERATLRAPEDAWMQSGGRKGVHTEYFGYLLSELQYMQRTYPGMEW